MLGRESRRGLFLGARFGIGDSSMHSSVETITPDTAKEWLERSAEQRQRKIINGRVNKLSKAMLAGEWKVTHQGIALDPDGVLVDGQHRLTAVVQSGVSVEMTVTRDVPREAFDVMDIGAARTPAAILNIAGYTDVNVLSAMVRDVLAYDEVKETRNRINTVGRDITHTELLAFLETERGELALEAKAAGSVIAHGLGRHGLKPHLGAAVMIIRESGADEQLVLEFTSRLADGVMLTAASPILGLRRFLSGPGIDSIPKGARANAILGMTLRAWNKWMRADADLRFAGWRTDIDIMPIPDKEADPEMKHRPRLSESA